MEIFYQSGLSRKMYLLFHTDFLNGSTLTHNIDAGVERINIVADKEAVEVIHIVSCFKVYVGRYSLNAGSRRIGSDFKISGHTLSFPKNS